MSSDLLRAPSRASMTAWGPGQLVDEWAAFARSPERDHFYWAFNLRELLRLPLPGRLTVDIAAERAD